MSTYPTNLAKGENALENVIMDYSGNIGFGINAGSTLRAGSNNTFIGTNTDISYGAIFTYSGATSVSTSVNPINGATTSGWTYVLYTTASTGTKSFQFNTNSSVTAYLYLLGGGGGGGNSTLSSSGDITNSAGGGGSAQMQSITIATATGGGKNYNDPFTITQVGSGGGPAANGSSTIARSNQFSSIDISAVGGYKGFSGDNGVTYGPGGNGGEGVTAAGGQFNYSIGGNLGTVGLTSVGGTSGSLVDPVYNTPGVYGAGKLITFADNTVFDLSGGQGGNCYSRLNTVINGSSATSYGQGGQGGVGKYGGTASGTSLGGSGYEGFALLMFDTAAINSTPTYPINNSTAIGYGASIDASNQIVLGTTSDTVYVPDTIGIANRSPTYAVDISGSLRITGNIIKNGSPVYTGTTGAQGVQGTQGTTGRLGPAGANSTNGATGPQGAFIGPQGFTGYTGTTGTQGFSGFTGSTGTQGYTGRTGPTGTQGFLLNTGAQGYSGRQGFTGTTGPQGYTGTQGNQGFIGADITGPQGPNGEIPPWIWGLTQTYNFTIADSTGGTVIRSALLDESVLQNTTDPITMNDLSGGIITDLSEFTSILGEVPILVEPIDISQLTEETMTNSINDLSGVTDILGDVPILVEPIDISQNIGETTINSSIITSKYDSYPMAGGFIFLGEPAVTYVLNDTITYTNIYYNSGNVGIGTTNPTYNLDLNGSSEIRNYSGRLVITDTVADANNIAIGPESQIGVMTSSAVNNISLGYKSLRYNTSGYENIAIGAGVDTSAASGPLENNTTGYRNIAIGYGALRNPTNTNNCIGIGFGSVGALNTGNNNTGIGYRSLSSLNNNSYNVAIAASTLSQNEGSYNTAVGYYAGYNSTGCNNCIFIGYNAQSSTPTASNEITLGNGSIGSLRCNVITITGLSDARDKKDIVTLDAGLDFITRVRPVRFNWINSGISNEDLGAEKVGFIAQELKSVQDDLQIVIPRLVCEENPDRLEATYDKLLPVLVKAIQELKLEVEQLKEQVKNKKANNL